VIVIARPAGQLANRLFQFAHFVAFSADTGITVANPSFAPLAADFPSFGRDAACRYPPPRRALPASLQAPLRALVMGASRVGARLPGIDVLELPNGAEQNLSEPAMRRRAKAARALVVTGWGFRDYPAFARHRELLRAVFRPAPARWATAVQATAAARKRCRVLVGVHRRRRDYAQWHGGRYFFSDDQYAVVMQSVEDLLGPDVGFLICSDEPVPPAAFGRLVTFSGPGAAVSDLTALSLCDYVIGPPSTFSAWASFMGSVPRYEVSDPARRPSGSDFTPHLSG